MTNESAQKFMSEHGHPCPECGECCTIDIPYQPISGADQEGVDGYCDYCGAMMRFWMEIVKVARITENGEAIAALTFTRDGKEQP